MTETEFIKAIVAAYNRLGRLEGQNSRLVFKNEAGDYTFAFSYRLKRFLSELKIPFTVDNARESLIITYRSLTDLADQRKAITEKAQQLIVDLGRDIRALDQLIAQSTFPDKLHLFREGNPDGGGARLVLAINNAADTSYIRDAIDKVTKKFPAVSKGQHLGSDEPLPNRWWFYRQRISVEKIGEILVEIQVEIEKNKPAPSPQRTASPPQAEADLSAAFGAPHMPYCFTPITAGRTDVASVSTLDRERANASSSPAVLPLSASLGAAYVFAPSAGLGRADAEMGLPDRNPSSGLVPAPSVRPEDFLAFGGNADKGKSAEGGPGVSQG